MRCGVVYPLSHRDTGLPEVVEIESLPRSGDPWLHHAVDGSVVCFLVTDVAFHVVVNPEAPIQSVEAVINLRP